MLVLSRRENEKVLFPSLGISIAVCQIKGNSIRLGIDAPRDIRVIRGELTQQDPSITADFRSEPYSPVENCPAYSVDSPMTELDRRLEAAKLAVHLAQNQLQQGLCSLAETALDQAIQCLQELDESISTEESATHNNLLVREAVVEYKTLSQPDSSIEGVGERVELNQDNRQHCDYQSHLVS